jgi:hypothetical protein
MSLFANYRADRLIAEVKSSGNPGSSRGPKGPGEAAGVRVRAPSSPSSGPHHGREKRETLAYVEVLAKLIDAKTLPLSC